MSINTDEILEIIQDICTNVTITDNDYDKSLNEMGIDSLDFMSIILELEEKYKIKIQEQDILEIQTMNTLMKVLNSIEII